MTELGTCPYCAKGVGHTHMDVEDPTKDVDIPERVPFVENCPYCISGADHGHIDLDALDALEDEPGDVEWDADNTTFRTIALVLIGEAVVAGLLGWLVGGLVGKGVRWLRSTR